MTELNIIDGQTNNDQIIPTTTASVRIRAPKRILHFSDGTLEEYSDDEVDGSDKKNANADGTDSQQIDVVSTKFRIEERRKNHVKLLWFSNDIELSCTHAGTFELYPNATTMWLDCAQHVHFMLHGVRVTSVSASFSSLSLSRAHWALVIGQYMENGEKTSTNNAVLHVLEYSS